MKIFKVMNLVRPGQRKREEEKDRRRERKGEKEREGERERKLFNITRLRMMLVNLLVRNSIRT